MSWEWLLAVAPLLLLLACPLVMWGMMRAMSGGACHGASDARGGDAGLQREVEVLRARVAELEGATLAPTADAGDR